MESTECKAEESGIQKHSYTRTGVSHSTACVFKFSRALQLKLNDGSGAGLLLHKHKHHTRDPHLPDDDDDAPAPLAFLALGVLLCVSFRLCFDQLSLNDPPVFGEEWRDHCIRVLPSFFLNVDGIISKKGTWPGLSPSLDTNACLWSPGSWSPHW